MSRRSDLDCKIYVGDLARDTNEKDLERAFGYYGRLRSVWVARNPAGFAFIEFEDPRDADDAVRGLDGTNLNGCRIRVEHSTGKVRPKPWLRGGRGSRGRRPFHPDDRCYECGETGHYAYDCNRYKGSRGSRRYSRSRSRSRSPRRRSYSRSRSHSRDNRRGGRDGSRDRYRGRDSRSRERYASRSPSRSRSRSAVRADN